MLISFDEMWTNVGARRWGKLGEWWIWTAVVEERNGSRRVDFEVGDRGEKTFLKLYERLPEGGSTVVMPIRYIDGCRPTDRWWGRVGW